MSNYHDVGLLLLDYQVALCHSEGAVGGPSGLGAEAAERGVLEHAARCLEAARKAGVFVGHARVAFDDAFRNRTNRSARFGSFERDRLLLRADPQAAICEEVAPVPGEPIVDKGCVSPFVGTNLIEVLISQGVRRLFLGGVATNFVVESAARHAGDSGFAVTVLEDLCAAYDDEMHRFSIDRMMPLFAEVSDSSGFIEFLRSVGGGTS